MVYYNDNDEYVCNWLQNLVTFGVLPWGEVDCRPIQTIKPKQLANYSQCHFFAGIGGWAYALQLAKWPENWPVWTGSCPCQPFSKAGKRRGFSDHRHLWPEWKRFIKSFRPPVIFGEQVAAGGGLKWFSRVHHELDCFNYEIGSACLNSQMSGSVDERQRLYFVADNHTSRLPERRVSSSIHTYARNKPTRIGSDKFFEGVVSKVKWINQPLLGRGVPRVPNRVGALSAYGNSINPWVAAEFIKAYIDWRLQLQ